MKRSLRIACVLCVLGAAGGMGYYAYNHPSNPFGGLKSAVREARWAAEDFSEDTYAMIRSGFIGVRRDIEKRASSVQSDIASSWKDTRRAIRNTYQKALYDFSAALEVPAAEPEPKTHQAQARSGGFINASYDIQPPPLTLSDIKRRQEETRMAQASASIAPSAGTPAAWPPEQDTLDVEAVLVPRQTTVISSSQDGRIAEIPVTHGDTFKKGDLLIAYDCADLEAEAEIARVEKDLTRKKLEGSDRLFKLDIISDLDRLGAQAQDRQADAKRRLYEARMNDCRITAQFDGRVTNRLANPGEYTRTDRVLLEVASNEPLQAEFLVPSKWLRWVNTGAPVTITLGETEHSYPAKVTRIHGEVDPVSQSIQMMATLDPYNDPLLPGMSGKAALNVTAIRDAGIRGYLETTPVPTRTR